MWCPTHRKGAPGPAAPSDFWIGAAWLRACDHRHAHFTAALDRFGWGRCRGQAVVGGVAVASASESPEAGQGQSRSGHDDLLRRSFDCKPPPIRGLTGAFPTLRHHHHTHREIGASRREQRAACRRVGQEEEERRRACGLVDDGHRVRRRSLRSIEARARGGRYVRQWGCGWLGREEARAEE